MLMMLWYGAVMSALMPQGDRIADFYAALVGDHFKAMCSQDPSKTQIVFKLR